jgi:hypothetical protein
MSETFEWLPELITLNDYEGNWPIYCDAIYDRFKNTMIEDQPRFEGKWIRCRRDPIYDNSTLAFGTACPKVPMKKIARQT